MDIVLGRLTEASVEYQNEYIVSFGTNGRLIIRYWVFRKREEQSEDDSSEYVEKVPPTGLAITLNGQRYAYLENSFVKNAMQYYHFIPDTMFVQAECGLLSERRRKELVRTTQSGVPIDKKTLELIETVLRDIVTVDVELFGLERKRIRKTLVESTINPSLKRLDRKRARKVLIKLNADELEAARCPGD
ncbi:MAG: hypothetical protein JSV77_05985 [Dehalococcoidales bacterium]|nr:MAG: hypothetical protein JSV77_05985 [Dehalococcoidales bacterium]